MMETASSLTIQAGNVALKGDLMLPKEPKGLVIFAHGSGSSRLSPRNRYVAHALNQEGLATLLFDLLTEEEEAVDIHTAALRFNITLLANRLIHTTEWILKQPTLKRLNMGYFGASTGAAAALIAAASLPEVVKAVVSRGGRVDLAGDSLPLVKAPTLMIVGALDEPVIPLNHFAQEKLSVENRLELVPGATHLFEEPGTLDSVTQLAADWFKLYLP